MLEKIKLALRITHNKLDDEIQDLINSCLRDLSISGVKNLDENDPLIQQAVKIYIKSEMEQDVNKCNRLTQAYKNLKISLCLCDEYLQ